MFCRQSRRQLRITQQRFSEVNRTAMARLTAELELTPVRHVKGGLVGPNGRIADAPSILLTLRQIFMPSINTTEDCSASTLGAPLKLPETQSDNYP